MFLFNSTAVPALLLVNPNPGPGDVGIGVVGAKATFRFDPRGGVTLDTQAPFELHGDPKSHPLGLLPADRLSRRGRKFEVMLLGHAHPLHGRAVRDLRVALSVGDVRRELAVFGNRTWVGLDGDRPTISAPELFERMPLTYERAFGGSFPARFDADTVADVYDPINRRGCGFDARSFAESLARHVGAPPGYPLLEDYQRRLPNLEDPKALIDGPGDAPEPVGWAPAPADIAVNHLALIRRESAKARAGQTGSVFEVPPAADRAAHDPVADPDEGQYQAHSDWVIDTPAAGARVRLEHLLPEAQVVEFPVPPLRVIADYEIYGRAGERELRPVMLVLLPDERAFYIVYASNFSFERGPATERAFRLRTATGWYQGT